MVRTRKATSAGVEGAAGNYGGHNWTTKGWSGKHLRKSFSSALLQATEQRIYLESCLRITPAATSSQDELQVVTVIGEEEGQVAPSLPALPGMRQGYHLSTYGNTVVTPHVLGTAYQSILIFLLHLPRRVPCGSFLTALTCFFFPRIKLV